MPTWRGVGAENRREHDADKLKAFTALWWDLAPQFRSWDVPPDDGQEVRPVRVYFPARILSRTKWRDRCECNKGAKRLADRGKLMGYECYQKGLREKELVVKPVQKPQKRRTRPPHRASRPSRRT